MIMIRWLVVYLSLWKIWVRQLGLLFPIYGKGNKCSKPPISTSSTAQGGGGSFKNRKPIGEIGCCESRVAERSHWWTDRWLRSLLFLSLAFSFSDYLPTYLSIYLSICLSIHPSVYLSLYLSIYLFPSLSLSLSLSACLSACLSVYLSVYLYIDLSIYRSIDLSIDLSIYPSIHLSIYPSIHLSIHLSLSLFLSLSFSLSLCLSVCLSISLSIHLSIYPSIHPSIHPSISLSLFHLPVYLSSCLSASVKTKLFCETSSFFKVDNIKNAAILRDFLIFKRWQHQTRSNSPRLSQCLHVTTSKTKQFCETFSFFEVDNIQNEAILRDFLQKWRVDCSADGLVPMRFAIFPLHLSKVLRLPRKSDARSYKVLHLSRKIILANLKIWCLLHCACHGKCIFADPLQVSHACHRFWKHYKTLTFCSLLRKCPMPCTCHAKRHLNLQWLVRYMWCFVHFDFEMCFAPQRRALFRHLNLQKWSGHGVLCTFWLRNVLRATTACTFSTSQSEPGVFCAFWLGNVLRATTACTFSSLIWPAGSARAAVASLLFNPPEPQIIGKNTVFRDFPTFSRICIFFLLTLSLLWSSLFYSSLLSDSSHLCFSSVHIVGSLTSNLPSTIWGGLHVIDIDTIWLAFWNDGPLIPAWWCENMLCQGQLTATCLVCWPACQTFIVW